MYNEATRTLTDKAGNKLIFNSNGQLYRIEDAYGVYTYISFNGNRISYVRDGAGRYAYFNYNGTSSSSGEYLISSISYSNSNRYIRFTYDSYSRLTRITYPDNTFSQYSYGESGNMFNLTSIRDQIGYKLQYIYGTNSITVKDSTNINRINYSGIYTCAEKSGSQIQIDYIGNKTYIKTKDGKRIVHVFNNAGIAYCTYVDESSQIDTNYIHIVNNFEYSSTGKEEAFAVSGTKDLQNYINNGSFENHTSCWMQNGDMGYCDGISYSASVEGDKSFKIIGEINKIKYLQQTISNPGDSQGFVFSAFAKGNSLPLNDKTKFRISAQIRYTDGTWEKEAYSDFNYLETEWQLAVVGIGKSFENKSKTIYQIRVKAEYSNNIGEVYFDNLRLTPGKYVSQKITNNYYVKRGGTTYPIESISAVKYTTEGFLAIRDNVTVSTYNGNDFILKADDIEKMIKQTVQSCKGCVFVNGELKTSEALVGEEFWGSNIAEIQFVINGVDYNIFDFILVNSQTIKIDNGSGQYATIYTNLKGDVIKSTITDEFNKEFSTEYTYDKGKILTQSDNYRNIKTQNTYDGYGNLIYTSTKNKNDTDQTNAFINQFSYNNSGNTLHTSYEERGGEYSTETEFNNTFGTLSSTTLANGQKINYNYYSDDSLNSISTTVGADSMANTFSYTRGLLTKLVTNNNIYLFEYDGFGTLIKTTVNNQVFSEIEEKKDCSYSSMDESTFNYTKIKYNNGVNASNHNDTYYEKRIYNKNESLVCKNGIYYDENNIQRTEELSRVEYDEYDRINKLHDKGLGQNKEIIYENHYKDDGKLDYVNVSGYHNGQIKENFDKHDRLIGKNITFASTKQYAYYYDKIGNSTVIDNRLSSINLPNSSTVSYEYDGLNRLKKREIQTNPVNCRKISESFSYLKSNYDPYNCRLDRTTNYVSMASYSGYGFSANVFYTYDKLGNITSVVDNGKHYSYEYDGISRLTRENNENLQFTKLYDYDANGNIIIIKEYAYSTGDNLQNEIVTTYYYSAGTHKDRLERVKKVRTATNEIIEEYVVADYDNIGNPCNFRGNMLKWNRGRNLTQFGNNTFSYNASGVRQEKQTAEGVTHKYFVEGKRIHKETRSNGTELWYYYDQSGITGINCNGTNYYFQKNVQNDVVRIFNDGGSVVASYIYDAWGNHKVLNPDGTENTSSNFIGNINPFRYRGYYYDVETGLFYCNSRYYDPEIDRFISPDSIDYLDPESINGLNLYAYCGNNPVMYVDPSGHSAILIGLIIGAILGAGIGFGTVAYSDYKDDGQIFNGSVKWYEYVGGTVTGSILGAACGGIIGAGGIYLSGAISSFFGKLTTDLFAYSISGAPMGTWEDYAIAFAFGGLTAGMSGKLKTVKTLLDVFARPAITQFAKIGTNRQSEFFLDKYGYDIFTRALTCKVRAPWKSFYRGGFKAIWSARKRISLKQFAF